MGYLLDTIHRKIERRPDMLESILWNAEGQQLSGSALVGFIVSEASADGVEKRVTTILELLEGSRRLYIYSTGSVNP